MKKRDTLVEEAWDRNLHPHRIVNRILNKKSVQYNIDEPYVVISDADDEEEYINKK